MDIFPGDVGPFRMETQTDALPDRPAFAFDSGLCSRGGRWKWSGTDDFNSGFQSPSMINIRAILRKVPPTITWRLRFEMMLSDQNWQAHGLPQPRMPSIAVSVLESHPWGLQLGRLGEYG